MVKKGIRTAAEQEDTDKAYVKMYDLYSAMTYETLYALIEDVSGALETKCFLGMDSAGLDRSQIEAILGFARVLGENVPALESAYHAHQMYKTETGK